VKKISIIILFVFFQLGFTQKLKLGEVTIDELNENVHPIDSSSAAAYLFKIGKTNFNLTRDGFWEITTEVDVKIKIYKKEGFKFADQEIAYFVGGNGKEKVYISDAYTYNLVGGKVEKTRLKSESEFKEEVNDKWNLKKITFPGVKEGSIIEFSYKIISPYISNFNDWHFQYEIPVNTVKYEVYIPQYFRYRTFITGFETISTEEKIITALDFNSTKYIYTAQNVLPIKDEEFVRNINNYNSVLKYELASIQYPNKPNENVALDWNDVSKSIYDNDNFGRELNFKSYFEDEIETIIKDTSSENEKLEKIFQYVQNSMVWNENNSYNCEKGVKKAFKEKVGNSADINLMLVAMLRHAGLDANPIIVSTRSNGIAIFPSRFAFNYVIVGVKLSNDENIVLLDATNKNTLPNILPLKVLNWSGRMLMPNGTSKEIFLEPKKQSSKSVTILSEIVDETSIKGKVREISNDYLALLYREKKGNLTNESLIEKLEKDYEGTEIDELTVKNDKSKPINLTYSFVSDNLVEIIGDKLYVSPFLFMELNENPFKSEKRNYPIEFDFPQKINFNISIKLPENYEVESFPESINYKTLSEALAFNFNGSVSNGMIQIVSSFEINSLLLPANDYEMVKSFFKEMINKQTEKIVLKKK
jgi:transglutaminase-like putative cysteine protease